MNNYTVFMKDGNDTIGEVEFTRLEVANRYLKHGRWEMSVTNLPGPVSWKSRIIVARNGVIVFSGPFVRVERKWTYAETDQKHFTGTCDNVYLETRYASPDPSLSTGPYTTQVNDARNGVAETVIRDYIRYNAGPNAVSSRQIAGLTLAADQTRGTTVKEKARWDDLFEMCRNLALNGNVGFEIVNFELRFYVPQDRSLEVVFSEDLDNIESYDYHGSPPKANYVLVGGGGTGTSRVTFEVGDALSILAHGRRETFVDARHTSDTAELAQKAYATLEKEGTEDLNIHVVPGAAATASMRPYDNVYLGDRVSIVIDGIRYTAQVQQIGFLDTQDKVSEHMVLGNFGKHNRYVTSADILSTLNNRVRNLEKI